MGLIIQENGDVKKTVTYRELKVAMDSEMSIRIHIVSGICAKRIWDGQIPGEPVYQYPHKVL